MEVKKKRFLIYHYQKKEVKELKDKGKVTKYFTATGFNHNVSHDIVKRYDGQQKLNIKIGTLVKELKQNVKLNMTKALVIYWFM